MMTSVRQQLARRRRTVQRGYNIVEMGIALAVLGLLLGGALVPLQVRYEQEQINTTKSYMEDAKGALLGYPQRNKTLLREIESHDGLEYVVPAGRPYLPCPDIDLDGLEDRQPMPSATVVVAITITTSIPGTCIEQKGLLPWKTLGVRDTDSWGNYLTYRVDPAFSNALFGFDSSIHADVFSRLDDFNIVTVRISMHFSRAISATITVQRFGLPLHANRDDSAAIVCSDFRNEMDGGCPKADLSNILAGIVTTVDLTVGARDIPLYNEINDGDAVQGVVDGAVFVLLSHGKNGLGAINRGGQCQELPAANVTDLAEVANAYYALGHSFLTTATGLKRVCEQPLLQQPANVSLQESLFVSAPIVDVSNAERHQPDDIVTWVGRSELAGVLMRGNAYPLERLEFLPE